jgi:ABC-type lipoprotein export system ATPase subunit
MIEIKNLTKTYTEKGIEPVTAINGLSAVFPEHKMVFIVGKSGSGKSSLLNILGLIDGFDSGEVIIDGRDVGELTPKEKNYYRSSKIGFVFQEYNIIEKYSIGQNIALSLDISGKDQGEREAVEAVLEKVGLAGYYRRKSNQMSGGQRQRVAIARAIIKEPDIILADEPTGALDTVTGGEIFQILKNLSKEKTVIIVSHDIESARKWGDIIYQMRDGQFVHTEMGGEATEVINADIDGKYNAVEVKKHIKSGKSVTIRAYRVPRAEAVGAEIQETKPPEPINPKSHMSPKQTFKIAGMAMFAGKVRLGVTLLLCSMVLALFGFSLMFGAFNAKKLVIDEVRVNGTPFITVKPLIEDGVDALGNPNFKTSTNKSIAYEILDANGIKYLKKNNIVVGHWRLRNEFDITANAQAYRIDKYSPLQDYFFGTAEMYEGFVDDMPKFGISVTGKAATDDIEYYIEDWAPSGYYVVPVMLTSYHMEYLRLLSNGRIDSPDKVIGHYVADLWGSSDAVYRYKVVGIINYDLTAFNSVIALSQKDRSKNTKAENQNEYALMQTLLEQQLSYLNYVYVAPGVLDTLKDALYSRAYGSTVDITALPIFAEPDAEVLPLWEEYLRYLGLKNAEDKVLSFNDYYNALTEMKPDTSSGNLLSSTAADDTEWSPAIPGGQSFVADGLTGTGNMAIIGDNLFSVNNTYLTKYGLDEFLPDYLQNAYARATETQDGIVHSFTSDYSVAYSSYSWMWRDAPASNINDGKLSTPFDYVQKENAGGGDIPIPGYATSIPEEKLDTDKKGTLTTLVFDFGRPVSVDAAAYFMIPGYSDGSNYAVFYPTTIAPDYYPLVMENTNTNWARIDLTGAQINDLSYTDEQDNIFYGLACSVATFAPVMTRYLALVVDRDNNAYLDGMEIQISYTDAAVADHTIVHGRDYNLEEVFMRHVDTECLNLAPGVTAETLADINANEYGIILNWNILRDLMPYQLWPWIYNSNSRFLPMEDDKRQFANLIQYIVENDIFGKTVYFSHYTNNGEKYYTSVNDIPVKILGISHSYSSDGAFSFITKKLADALYKVENTYSVNAAEDILIPYADRDEISKLYDLFGKEEFARYLRPSQSTDGLSGSMELYTAMAQNNSQIYADADDGTGTMKKYILSINSTAIYPIYKIEETFGFFNEIFKIIAVVLIVIMVILLWSFMSFTIKTRTKDIGILISLGASKRDLAFIFVIEGALIAIGQIIISIVSAVIAKHYVRELMVKRMGAVIEKYNILSFGIWQMLIMALIAVSVTALSTTLPLWSLSKKQPVEIIRKIET